MEGKRITELSGAGTATGEGLRFSCHFEENSILFCDLEGAKVKTGGPAGAGLHPGPQENSRRMLSLPRPCQLPICSIHSFPLWVWTEIHHIPVNPVSLLRALDSTGSFSRTSHNSMVAPLPGMQYLGSGAWHITTSPLRALNPAHRLTPACCHQEVWEHLTEYVPTVLNCHPVWSCLLFAFPQDCKLPEGIDWAVLLSKLHWETSVPCTEGRYKDDEHIALNSEEGLKHSMQSVHMLGNKRFFSCLFLIIWLKYVQGQAETYLHISGTWSFSSVYVCVFGFWITVKQGTWVKNHTHSELLLILSFK